MAGVRGTRKRQLMTKHGTCNQWLQYDKAFSEWAASKDVKLLGDLNLPIFCHFLEMQQRATLQPQVLPKPSNSPYTRSSDIWLWNFEEACTRRGC